MPPDKASTRPYFNAPARAERLQLLLHLIRNAGEIIYLRAPAGAGKTLFAHRMLDVLDGEMASVWVRGGIDDDVAAAVVEQLGLDAGAAARWPDGLLAELGGRDLLVVVDDADQLGAPAVERLAALYGHGGRLLFIGRGGLAQTTREWDVQYVDLPPFTVEQSTAFLRGNAGAEADLINDDLAGFLHHSAHGMPGPLLESLAELLARAHRQSENRERHRGLLGPLGWQWIAGIAGAVLIGLVLLYQDQVNALFEPREERTVEADDAPQPNPPEQPADSALPPATEVTQGTTAERPRAPALDDSVAVQNAPTAGVPSIALPELSPLPAPVPDAEQPVVADRLEADRLEEVVRDAVSAVQNDAAAEAQAAVGEVARATDGAVNVAAAPVQAPTGSAPATPSNVAPAVISTPSAATATMTGSMAGTQTPAMEKMSEKAPVEEAAVVVGRATAPAPVVAGERAAVLAAEAVPVENRPTKSEPVEPGQGSAAPVTTAKPASLGDKRAETGAQAEELDVVDGAESQTTAPAPVEERTPVTKTTEKVEEKKVATTPTPVEAAPPRTPQVATAADVEWLKSRPAGRYTLQLVGARSRAAVEKFVRTHAVARPYAIFQRPLGGRPWYSLVAGDYASRDAAVAARARLPDTLKTSDAWPRSFASIHKILK